MEGTIRTMGNRPILARSNSVIMTACNRSMMARAFVKVWYAEIQLGFPTFANCSCKNIFALKKCTVSKGNRDLYFITKNTAYT